MSLLQLLLLLMLLAQSGFCLTRQVVGDNKCNDRQTELFAKQQYLSSSDTKDGYHLIVKEKLSSVTSSKDSHLTDEAQMVEYQSKCIIIIV